MLHREEICLGGYHREDFRQSGVGPFVWSEALADYYRDTDSGLTGQPAWNRRPEKLAIRRWMGQKLAGISSEPLDILVIGDGAGFDSLYLAKCGHRVAYSEESRLNIELAGKIFSLNELPIEIVDDPSKLKAAAFDVVVCLDVLEHVEDPPAFVASIAEKLRPGGRLVVHAPFFFVSELNPTHLKSNIRFSGALKTLYGCHDLHLIDGRFFWDPIIVQKPDQNGRLARWTAWTLVLRFTGLLLAFARFSRAPHNWVATRKMQQRSDRWLPGLEPE
jgi:SAM-dependent methyltransferase